MNSLIQKFSTGLKTDIFGTLVKVIRYGGRRLASLLADGLYWIVRPLLYFLPTRTLARLKHSLTPTIRLDYPGATLKLQADSLVDLFRAQACEKEPETVHWIESQFRPGDVFYDVGANVGAYALIACVRKQGHGVIYAFEPSFSTYHQLCRNVILNGFQSSIIPCMIALADRTGTAVFNYQSLEAGSADHWLGDDLSQVTAQFVYHQKLLTFTMDDLVNRLGFQVPNHIKLDVDGSEVQVLQGAAKTLSNNNLKSILVEVREEQGMSSQVDEILRAAGFTLLSRTDRGNHLIWNCIYTRDLGAVPLTNAERNETRK